MLTLFYLLMVEQILQGLYNLWDGIRWLRLAQRRAGSHSGFYTPRVALFCPVKGVEPGLELNLAALIGLDYANYEIFFTMASADDPARKILDRLATSTKRKIHMVIAGRPDGCGEKVNNLRTAVQQAAEGFDVFVFADSDGRPGRGWLTRLVAPLADAMRVNGVPFTIVDVPAPDPDHKLILARTDQHVAWRGDTIPDNPAHLVDKLLGRSSNRSPG